MDSSLMLELAREISRQLSVQLDDPVARHVRLNRDEAVICLGLVNGLAEILAAERH